MKKSLLLILPLLAIWFHSCSGGGNDAVVPDSRQPKSVTVDARNPTSSAYIADGNWTVGDIEYNQAETDILYNDKKVDFSTETGWCSLAKDGANLNITLIENTDEYKYRRCRVSIDAGNTIIDLTITQDTWKYTSSELEPIVNELIQAGNDGISIGKGKFNSTGDTPFDIEATLTKTIDRIETFYPYSLHYNEYVRISGDDGKNIRLKGVVLTSDFVYDQDYYSGYNVPHYGNAKAGTYEIVVSGAFEKTFSYTAN